MNINIPFFDKNFKNKLESLFKWRRDVRRFKSNSILQRDIDYLLNIATFSPSVGNSQPWRFIIIKTLKIRKLIIKNFNTINNKALNSFSGSRANLYASLKLSGLKNAPVQIAVFTDTHPKEGYKLGQITMPETLQYSSILAIYNICLIARTINLGVGWVSILDPKKISKDLNVPKSWMFTAYLCIGYPEEEHTDPELVRYGWQNRTYLKNKVFYK